MNFLKGSLFRRNTEPEELEPMEESGGGILAVWGSPGCGKTVTAVKIARHLAAQKKNTVLLLCDMTAPITMPSLSVRIQIVSLATPTSAAPTATEKPSG